MMVEYYPSLFSLYLLPKNVALFRGRYCIISSQVNHSSNQVIAGRLMVIHVVQSGV
jgi:hypothetical protein